MAWIGTEERWRSFLPMAPMRISSKSAAVLTGFKYIGEVGADIQVSYRQAEAEVPAAACGPIRRRSSRQNGDTAKRTLQDDLTRVLIGGGCLDMAGN